MRFAATLLLSTACLLSSVFLAGCGAPAPSPPTATDDSWATTDPTDADPKPPIPAPRPSVANQTPAASLAVVSEGFYPANPKFVLNVTELPANSTLTVTYTNKDLNPLGKHDWYLDGVPESQTAQIETGKETKVTFLAPTEPGTYVYYCTVPTHKDRGMQGELRFV